MLLSFTQTSFIQSFFPANFLFSKLLSWTV